MTVVYSILVIGAIASVGNFILQGYWFYVTVHKQSKNSDS